MNIIQRLINRIFERRFHPSQPAEWFLNLLPKSKTGADVTPQTSLQLSTVYACVRVISETAAMLPLFLYEKIGRNKERATNHPLYSILHNLANPEMTAFELRELLISHVCLWGNGYAEIEYNNRGQIVALWPLRSDKVRVARINGELKYIVHMPKGPDVELPSWLVWHIKGLGYDGTVGYSPIDLAREAIGLGMATEEFGARFFGNGAQMGTILKHPGVLSDQAYNRLKETTESRHQGLSNAHRLMILEEGMDIKSISVPPENAQFLETRKFQGPEIARFYRMPLHKIGYLENATFSNIEHQAIEFVTDTIQPWCTRIEQSIFKDLLTQPERQRYYAEHLLDGLLRGDVDSRYRAYATARQWGWASANDIRERENQNPVDGGDIYLIPLNMIPAGQINQLPVSTENDSRSLPDIETRNKSIAVGRRRLAASYERIILDVVERVIRREVNDVRRAATKFLKRDAYDFSNWLNEFYREHKEFWQKQILPTLLTFADQIGINVSQEINGNPANSDDIRAFVEAYALAMAARNVGESQGILQKRLDDAITEGIDPLEPIEQTLDDWQENRPTRIAQSESIQSSNAFAKSFYVLAGITSIRWIALGESCPYCNSLSGRVISIQKFFLEANDPFQPDGADRPLTNSSRIGHPPAHGGCDCMIVASVL